MNCPSCGAPMRPDGDALKCDYCHSVVFPEKDESGVRVLGTAPLDGSGDACPLCKTLLVQAAVAGTAIFYCTACRGMSIPMDKFETILDGLRREQHGAVAAAPPADSRDLDRSIPCPHCHRRMDTHFYAGGGSVVMDTCETCAIHWLDHGELMRLAQAPDNLRSDSFYDRGLSW